MAKWTFAFGAITFVAPLLCGCGDDPQEPPNDSSSASQEQSAAAADEPGAAINEPEDTIDALEKVVRDGLVSFECIHDELSRVHDVASARTAGEKIEVLTEQMGDTVLGLTEVEASVDEFAVSMAELREKYGDRHRATFEGIRHEVQRISQQEEWQDELRWALAQLSDFIDLGPEVADMESVDSDDGDYNDFRYKLVKFESPGANWYARDLDGRDAGEALTLPATIKVDAATVRLALSPDARWLAGADSDHTIHLWNLATGQATKQFFGHGEEIRDLRFSPDSEKLLSADAAGAIQLWDVTRGAPDVALKTESAMATVFSPDGRFLAVGMYSFVWLLNIEGQKVEHVFECHDFPSNLAFSPDGQLLVAGEHETVSLWHTDSGELVWQTEVPRTTTGTSWVGFLPEGDIAVSLSSRQMLVLDLANGSQKARHPGQPVDFASGDGRFCGRTMNYRPPIVDMEEPAFDEVSVFAVPDGHVVRTVVLNESITSAALSRDARRLAIGTKAGEVHLYDLSQVVESRPVSVVRELHGHGKQDLSVAFSHDGKWLACGSSDGSVRIWDVATGTLRETLTGFKSKIVNVEFLPATKTLAITAEESGVHLRDIETGEEQLLTIEKAGFSNSDLVASSVSPTGKFIAAADDGLSHSRFHIWEVESGRRITASSPTESVRGLAWSPDGQKLAFVPGRGIDDSPNLVVWNVLDGKTVRTWIVKDTYSWPNVVAWTPDGRQVAYPGEETDGVLFFPLDPDEDVAELAKFIPRGVLFSPDGRLLYVNEVVHIGIADWRREDVLLRLVRSGRDEAFEALAISPDGHTLATAYDNGTVKLWDVSSIAGPAVRPAPAEEPDELSVAARAAIEGKQVQRTWTSDNGRHRILARLVFYLGGQLLLEKRDGTEVQVSLKRLSDRDQLYMKGE